MLSLSIFSVIFACAKAFAANHAVALSGSPNEPYSLNIFFGGHKASVNLDGRYNTIWMTEKSLENLTKADNGSLRCNRAKHGGQVVAGRACPFQFGFDEGNTTFHVDIFAIRPPYEVLQSFDGLFGLGRRRNISENDTYCQLSPIAETLTQQMEVDNRLLIQLCGARRALNEATNHTVRNATHLLLKGDVLKTTGTLVFGVPRESFSAYKYPKLMAVNDYRLSVVDIRLENKSLDYNCSGMSPYPAIVDISSVYSQLPSFLFSKLAMHLIDYLNTSEPELIANHESIFNNDNTMFCYKINDDIYTFDVNVYKKFPTLELDFVSDQDDDDDDGNKTVLKFLIAPQQYIRYVGVYEIDSELKDCFVFGISPTNSAQLTIGLSLLEGFDIMLNGQDDKMGFVTSTCPSVIPGVDFKNSEIRGPFDWQPFPSNSERCSPPAGEGAANNVTWMSALSMGGFALVLTPAVVGIYLGVRKRNWCRKKEEEEEEEEEEEDAAPTEEPSYPTTEGTSMVI